MKDLGPKAIAWEFVRRSPQYKNLWNKYHSLWSAGQSEETMLAHAPDIISFDELVSYDETEWEDDLAPWHLEYLLNPDYGPINTELILPFTLRRRVFRFRDNPAFQGNKLSSNEFNNAFQRGQAIVVIDPRYSINKQLQRIGEYIHDLYPEVDELKTHAVRSHDLAKYLRLLDSLSSDVTAAEKANIIFPHAKTLERPDYLVRDGLKQALEISNGRFLSFLFE